MEAGLRRWVVDITKWEPHPRDFSFALSLLPPEHSSVTRFVKMDDRKRALVSRMLQSVLVHEVLGIPYHEIIIKRTHEGKPYLECDNVGLKFPNFNFNASHHGDYVAIASEPLCLVGLDIVSYSTPQRASITEFVKTFSSYFSSSEWENIINAGDPFEILTEFYRYWSLKEAYVKTIGTGIQTQLGQVEFHHSIWTNIKVKVNGQVRSDWRFWLLELGKQHCVSCSIDYPDHQTYHDLMVGDKILTCGYVVSIARGLPRSACLSFKTTLGKVELNREEYNVGFNLPNVNFTTRSVEQLISVLSSAVNGIPSN